MVDRRLSPPTMIDSTSNGEPAPVPLPGFPRRAQRQRAAADFIAGARAEYRNDPRPTFLAYQPRTQAGFAGLPL